MILSLISGNANRPLAERIAQLLNENLSGLQGPCFCKTKVERFPDGETSVQIMENVRGHDVYIVQPTNSPANENLMELLIMIDAAKRASAGRITVVIPFYGYARQDRKDKPRVPITAKLVANLLTEAGADRVITMDLHAPQIQGFFDIPTDHLFAAPVFVQYLKSKGSTSNLVVMAPDVGSTKLASMYAGYFNCNFGFITKHRVDANTVHTQSVVGDVNGHEVLVVDDMTASAGTIIAAAQACRKNGATKVVAAVTHGLFTDVGYQRMAAQTELDELITTNTTNLPDFTKPETLPPSIPRNLKVKVLDVAPLFAEAMLRTYQNRSITDLFSVKGY